MANQCSLEKVPVEVILETKWGPRPTKGVGSRDRFRVSGWFLMSADDAVYSGSVGAQFFFTKL